MKIILALTFILSLSCAEETSFKSNTRGKRQKDSKVSSDLNKDSYDMGSKNPTNDSSTNNSKIGSVEDVSNACRGNTKILEKVISFPASSKTCPWGVGDNLQKKKWA